SWLGNETFVFGSQARGACMRLLSLGRASTLRKHVRQIEPTRRKRGVARNALTQCLLGPRAVPRRIAAVAQGKPGKPASPVSARRLICHASRARLARLFQIACCLQPNGFLRGSW